MQDKLEKVREFIQANPGKSNRWYADNNGLLKRATFYKYLNDIIMDRSMDRSMDNLTDKTDNESASASASSDEIIQNLFEEHEKNETRKLKNRQYNHNTRNRKTLVEELQKENEELKSKYEELIQNPRIYYYELDDCALDELETWFGKDADKRKEKLLK